jgi:hypothetical protein
VAARSLELGAAKVNLHRLGLQFVVFLILLTIGQIGCGIPDQDGAEDPSATAMEDLGFELPGLVPVPFAPRLTRSDDAELAVALSPRFDELIFTRFSFDESGIRFALLTSKIVDGEWNGPLPVQFSSEGGEAEAFYNASGDRLYFYSGRCEPGAENPPREMNLWFVEWEGEAWGEPRFLGQPEAPIKYGWSGSLSDGNTFFFTARPYDEPGLAEIYQVPISDDGFGVAESIGPPVNTRDYTENEPAVAPDGSYMVFYSAGRPDNLSSEMLGDLYISFRYGDGTWTEPQHIDEPINSADEENWPRISNDGKYLFFSSNRREGADLPDLYWVSTEALEKYRPAISD